MRIVFMGTPDFAVPSLEYLKRSQHDIIAVYTRPDKPSGRNLSLTPPPVKKVALALDLPVYQESFKQAEAIARLAALQPEAIVVAAFGQILPQKVLDVPRYGCINVHASLLPRHRGASPISASILAGDEFTGVSIMQITTRLDTGPVYSRAQIPISGQDTTGVLTEKLAGIGAQLLAEVLVRIERGEKPQPQNEAEATYEGQIAKEQGKMDWHLPAIELWRRVRAFQPWPGAYTTCQGKQIKIIEAVPLKIECAGTAGQVVALAPQYAKLGAAFGVAGGSGILGIVQLQMEGKRVMSSEEFLRGQRDFIGALLG